MNNIRSWRLSTVQEIERAIGSLTSDEYEELRVWFEQYGGPQPIDLQLEADLAAGRLDKRIKRAMDDHGNGRTKPL